MGAAVTKTGVSSLKIGPTRLLHVTAEKERVVPSGG